MAERETANPYWCRLCGHAHPVKSITDGHNKITDRQEEDR